MAGWKSMVRLSFLRSRATAVGLALAAALSVLGPAPTTSASAVADCQFQLGFRALHDLDATDIGNCTGNQMYAANGDAQQSTARGLMVWRKADNFTAFTDGFHTWVNGPNGLQERLNSDRFPWEATASSSSGAALDANVATTSQPSLDGMSSQFFNLMNGDRVANGLQ